MNIKLRSGDSYSTLGSIVEGDNKEPVFNFEDSYWKDFFKVGAILDSFLETIKLLKARFKVSSTIFLEE